LFLPCYDNTIHFMFREQNPDAKSFMSTILMSLSLCQGWL
jgi:hypothetical protein